MDGRIGLAHSMPVGNGKWCGLILLCCDWPLAMRFGEIFLFTETDSYTPLCVAVDERCPLRESVSQQDLSYAQRL